MKKALLVVALIAATLVTYRWTRDDAPVTTTDDSKLALDRIWIDHIPRNDRDTIQIFAALTEQPVGIFQAASQWAGKFEIFKYSRSGDTFSIVYPQNNDKEKVTTKAKPCRDQGHDYCMDVEGSSRGAKRYYSRKGWEIDSSATAEEVQKQADLILESITVEN